MGKPDRNKHAIERKDSMKLYNVYVYNTRDNYHDCYMVKAVDPVDARGVAVQRLIDETGEGLNVWEILGVKGA